ncbi:MAG: serine/threonine protein phosphatase [Tardiphaga sp.]|uniref:RAD55 family ATPase n=1 Tax=Tardiphaga sp. TaxID=1926292 RepID=UPI002635572D|nr:ATPase domain-containing protein [Tardiphaga sp.]MDB5501357.1 serine/threonine protein phosphatase [Tardiphaga sp.]
MTSDSDRFSTGVPGLDTILGGGVFDGGIYIIQGAPGAGKTILGNQICFAQAAQGRNALYITLLAESHARMIGHMRRLTFFDEAAIPDRMSYVGAFKTLEDDGLRGLLDVVRREVRTRNASILVLDGLITVHEKARSELELKKFIHELQTQAAFSNCTMFLLTSAFDAEAYPPEHTMVDGLIELQTSLHGRRAERSLQVHKLRGSWFMGGKHSYRITESGHAIYPRVEALLETPSVWDSADGPMVSVGIAGVDKMLGGGVDTHSVTVVLGPSGSGKTTAGLQFLTGGPADEPAMHFGFHENPRALAIKARTLKLSMDERGDKISLLWRPQTEAILDEVATELLGAIKARGVRRLVIDGIEGFSKLTDEKTRIGSFLSALCNELRALGVTTLATAETDHAGITPGQPLKGVNQTGLSAVAENIIALHLAALRSENHRLMTILKSRDRRTDMRMRRFEIAEGGIALDEDYRKAEVILRDISSQGPAPAPLADLKLAGE